MATTKDICKVCGAPLESAVCRRCGWTPMLFPARVPKAISDFESERIEVAKEMIKKEDELNKQKKELQIQKQAYDNSSSQLSEARKEIAQKDVSLKEAEAKARNDSKKIEEQKKQISQLESAAKVVEAQRKDLVEKLTKANESLTKEIEDHKKTKTILEELKAHKTTTIIDPERPQPQPRIQPQPRPIPSQQQGQPVAKIIFSSGTQTVQENVFDGNNNYPIPSSMNSPVSGDAFRIESINGKVFRLYDLCGLTCKINGDKIGTKGMQLYDKDYFSIGHITLQIKLPKMNLRDLL